MRFFNLFCACALTALLSGCFSSGGQQPRYYTIAIKNAQAESLSPAFPYRVAVKKASIDPAYRRNNIVYRESPYDFMFYNYSVWAARPEYLVEQAFVNNLKQRNLFAVVETDVTAKPDYEVSIHVNAIEEIDEGSSRYGRLAIAVLFKKSDAEGYVWAKDYDEKKSYDTEDVKDFVATISELLDSYFADAVAGIRESLK